MQILSANCRKFKNCQKTGIFDDFFFNFGSFLAQELNSFICKKKLRFFDTPGTPGGASIYVDLDKNNVPSGCVNLTLWIHINQLSNLEAVLFPQIHSGRFCLIENHEASLPFKAM